MVLIFTEMTGYSTVQKLETNSSLKYFILYSSEMPDLKSEEWCCYNFPSTHPLTCVTVVCN